MASKINTRTIIKITSMRPHWLYSQLRHTVSVIVDWVNQNALDQSRYWSGVWGLCPVLSICCYSSSQNASEMQLRQMDSPVSSFEWIIQIYSSCFLKTVKTWNKLSNPLIDTVVAQCCLQRRCSVFALTVCAVPRSISVNTNVVII